MTIYRFVGWGYSTNAAAPTAKNIVHTSSAQEINGLFKISAASVVIFRAIISQPRLGIVFVKGAARKSSDVIYNQTQKRQGCWYGIQGALSKRTALEE
jgi:hypothetical protein